MKSPSAEPLKIMSALGGRVSTSVDMLPSALRTNRPSRTESDIAADVIEQLLAEVRVARLAGFKMADGAPAQEERDAPVARQARDSAQWLKTALHRAIGALPEAHRRSCDILFHTVDGVVDRHVAEGREPSHYRESYDRAVQRLVLMRQLIPAEALLAFEVEWRTRRQEPPPDAAELRLPEAIRGELHAMASQCGAVSYTPGPLRAVRGVSLTFEQLEAFAVLASAAMWPVPAVESR